MLVVHEMQVNKNKQAVADVAVAAAAAAGLAMQPPKRLHCLFVFDLRFFFFLAFKV